MNKPVTPWTGTKGYHKEEHAKILPAKMTKSEKKGIRKNMAEDEERKRSKAHKATKTELHKAHAHMKMHGG